jgi:hypothetical protein
VPRSQRLVLVGIAVAVAVVAFLVLRPAEGGRGTGEPAGSGVTTGGAANGGTTQAEPRPSPPKPAYTVIRIEGGKPVGGVKDVEVKSGDTVRLAIRSDRRDEVHIHGYDRYVQVGPGRSGKARFRADLEGVYEIELHSDSTEIASLRIEP